MIRLRVAVVLAGGRPGIVVMGIGDVVVMAAMMRARLDPERIRRPCEEQEERRCQSGKTKL